MHGFSFKARWWKFLHLSLTHEGAGRWFQTIRGTQPFTSFICVTINIDHKSLFSQKYPDTYFVMFRTLALISLFLTYAFGVMEFCVEDYHCGPGEKCLMASNARRIPMNVCSPDSSVVFCKSTRDCLWYLGMVCRNERCQFILK